MELLHSFGAGIAFAVGVTVGAVLCRIATKEGRREMVDQLTAHQTKMEERLLKTLEAQQSMALSLAEMARSSAQRGGEK